MGMPDWIAAMAAAQQASIEGKVQVPAETASEMPCSRSVSSAMNAERALGAHEERREVVSGAGLAGSSRGHDDLAIRKHNLSCT